MPKKQKVKFHRGIKAIEHINLLYHILKNDKEKKEYLLKSHRKTTKKCGC